VAAGKAKIENRGSKIAIFHPRSSILYPRCLTVLALLFALTHSIPSSALDVPLLRGRVNDYASLLPTDRARALEERLVRFEQETGHQIAVLTIPSLEGEDLEGFSIRVGETWKIGQKGFDNGAILLIARNDRKLRIEVGYGLEGVLPDAIASRIIREVIVPHFRANDYPGGIEAGVDAVMKVTRGEPLPETARSKGPPRRTDPFLAAPLLFYAALLALFVGITQRTFPRGAFGGAIAGAAVALAGALGSAVGLWIAMLLVSTLLGALGSLYASTAWGGAWTGGRRRRYDYWGSNFGGGFGGGSFGGGGGFSGGGGGFGGGGASGSW